MGVYRAWFCPKAREFLKLENVKLFGFELPDHAGALILCFSTRWRGLEVVHFADEDSGYETLEDHAEKENWKNVWVEVWDEWKRDRVWSAQHEEYGDYEDSSVYGRWSQVTIPRWEEKP